jgi:hypothetical protein
MGGGTQIRKAESPILLFALILFAAFACLAQVQRPALPLRLPFTAAEQQAYLDGLIRNAPSKWKHGKNWVFIDPYVLGRTISPPDGKTICPDLGHGDLFNDSVDLPPWVYAASSSCAELSDSHATALLVLEDPKDSDAGYFLFLVCDAKRSRNHCDVQPSGGEYGMKLEESNKGGSRQFDVLAETTDDKIARFSVSEVWHMRNATPEPGDE